MTSRLAAFWNRYLGDPLRAVEADSLAYRQSEEGHRADWKTMTVLITAAVCLTIQNFFSHPSRIAGPGGFAIRHLSGDADAAQFHKTLGEWGGNQGDSLTWWAACALVTYAMIPVLAIKFGLRERVLDYGFKVRGILVSWPVYALFVAVMVPIVVVVSAEERFQESYPFYRIASKDELGRDFLMWEVLYALQFVALEFFFRGFIVHGTKHRFGIYSTFVMMVPYCMIHFGKPLSECTASIIAGIALGFVSLATRSIWLGATLHISVAWSMDFATLARRGLVEL